jgi:hypothetical protein
MKGLFQDRQCSQLDAWDLFLSVVCKVVGRKALKNFGREDHHLDIR